MTSLIQHIAGYVRGSTDRAGASRGQIIVLFALALVAIVAGVGLVIDGGSAWAQRRNEQRVADLAALAGARAEANWASKGGIIQAALDTAAANGFAASEVQVNIPPTQGEFASTTADCPSAPGTPSCWIEVLVNRAHGNTFSRVIGMDSWMVTARAVSVGGIANAVSSNVSPIMFNESALLASGFDQEKTYCNPNPAGCPPDNAVPTDDNQFDWTTFCISQADCNVDSDGVKDIIWGEGVAEIQVDLNDDIGPHNGGEQDTLCKNIAQSVGASGSDGSVDPPMELAVAIVVQDPVNPDNGSLIAFWIFELTKVDCKGQGQEITGRFLEKNWPSGDETSLTITPGAPAAQSGEFVAELVE